MSTQNPQSNCSIKSIRYPVPSATRTGITHTVTQDIDTGARSCTCKAGDFPRTRGRCWHLPAINAGLIKPPVRVAPRPPPAPLPTFTRARTSSVGLELASSLDV